MRVSVTQKHLDKGFRGSCSSDPVALAMRDLGLSRVSVTHDHIAWHRGHKAYSVKLTYDNGHPVVPFDFELEV